MRTFGFGLMMAVLVCCLVPSSACKAKPEPLLQQNYTVMTDAELVTYSREIDQALEDCMVNEAGQLVGQDTMTGESYGEGIGVSLGMKPGTKGCDGDGLRARQAEVRAAMQQRGVAQGE